MDKLPISVWDDWHIIEHIGSGSFAHVYKAERHDQGFVNHSAIKIIRIPKDKSDIQALRADGIRDSHTRNYLEGVVSNLVNEIRIMSQLQGAPNTVQIHDYKVIEFRDQQTWEIHIRMELLTSLEDHIQNHPLSENQVLQLGVDICTALEYCLKQSPPIIHRDIKPDNIFYSKHGYFKIGDFGTARELEKSLMAKTHTGTPNYMAPEIVRGEAYTYSADIYSLGIVLYRLLNDNQLPFCEVSSTYEERHTALHRRLSGEKLPQPKNATKLISEIILTACEYDKSARFQNPTAFKNALNTALKSTSEHANRHYNQTVMATPPQPEAMSVSPSKRNSKKTLILALSSFIFLAAIAFFAPKIVDYINSDNSDSTSENVVETETPHEASPSETELAIEAETEESHVNTEAEKAHDEEKEVTKALKEARDFSDAGQPSESIRIIEQALVLYPDNTSLTNALRAYQKLEAQGQKAAEKPVKESPDMKALEDPEPTIRFTDEIKSGISDSIQNFLDADVLALENYDASYYDLADLSPEVRQKRDTWIGEMAQSGVKYRLYDRSMAIDWNKSVISLHGDTALATVIESYSYSEDQTKPDGTQTLGKRITNRWAHTLQKDYYDPDAPWVIIKNELQK